MLTIALYGDSIGRGVAYDEVRSRYHYLRDGFDRLMEKEGQARFLNHSRFGATAHEGLAELEPLTELDADAVVVEYGGNDCSPDWKAVSEDPDTMHPPRTALSDFEEILARFVRKIRELGKIAVLVTPPPLVAERFVPWVSKGLDEQAILRFLGDAHHVYRWQEQYACPSTVARQTAQAGRQSALDEGKATGSLLKADSRPHPEIARHRAPRRTCRADLGGVVMDLPWQGILDPEC